MEHTLLICIDDTDSLDSPGTGQVLEELLACLAEEGLGLGSFITRHQLLIHPDIPYTSHLLRYFITEYSPYNISSCIFIPSTF